MDKLFWVLLFFVLILFSLYLPINISREKVYEFRTWVDDLIPLWTPFIVIYISYFGLLVFSAIYLLKIKADMSLKEGLLAIILACALAYIFYIFFQNKVERPIIESNNIFDRVYSWINSWVGPYNAFPSLHVAISTIIVTGYFKSRSKIFGFILIWVILIIASTVLTKQHYFLDVVSGLALGILSFKTSEYLLHKFGKITR